MFEVDYEFSNEYIKQIKNEIDLHKLGLLISYPEGRLIIRQGSISTERLDLNPDVFFMWLNFEVIELEKVEHKEILISDFNGLIYDYYLKDNKLIIQNETDEIIKVFDVTIQEYLTALVDLQKSIRDKLISINSKVVETDAWKAYF